jgi:hypothetical protein
MAECVHQGVVTIAAVTGAKQIANQQVELAVAEALEKIGEELLFLLRPDVVKRVVGARALERGVILFLGLDL